MIFPNSNNRSFGDPALQCFKYQIQTVTACVSVSVSVSMCVCVCVCVQALQKIVERNIDCAGKWYRRSSNVTSNVDGSATEDRRR